MMVTFGESLERQELKEDLPMKCSTSMARLPSCNPILGLPFAAIYTCIFTVATLVLLPALTLGIQ